MNAQNKPKDNHKDHKNSESDESDIFEGLNEEKKERIMSEVAELYEANIALQVENNMLKKKQEKFQKGIHILDSKEGHLDSMNVDSELEEEGFFVKNGSYTDNDELGNSHYNETIGSIHNIWIDPTSESYIEGLKREQIAKIKPDIIPVLDFEKLNRPDLVPSLKLKGFKMIKASHSGKVPHYSLSNRTMGERISFTIEGDNEDSQQETPDTFDKVSFEIEVEEKKNSVSQNKMGSSNHIMIKDVHNVSSNINDNSQQYDCNLSKAHNSWFANSSEATKKNSYLSKINTSVASPVLQKSFDKSGAKPFSPFQSSESTVKRQGDQSRFDR